jgi:hypothetical protein
MMDETLVSLTSQPFKESVELKLYSMGVGVTVNSEDPERAQELFDLLYDKYKDVEGYNENNSDKARRRAAASIAARKRS